jgi:outer membrane protein OmpA-like peptidoglycan-associated protein
MPNPRPRRTESVRAAAFAARLAVCLFALRGGQALAQVTVDLHALDAPPHAAEPPPGGAAPAHKPAPHAAPPHRTATKPPAHPTQQDAAKPHGTPPATAAAPPAPPKPIAPAAPTPPAPPAAVIGIAPPPAAVIPPPAPADAPMAPEPPPAISASAATTVDALPPKDGTGVRLDFANGETDLTQGTADAVKALVAGAPKDDAITFNVMAYATGVPEDPSTARRLSLSRALSVRGALMAYGVPSTHIYLRALGAQAGDGPADRVDVMVMGANAANPPPGTPPSGNTKP